MIRASINLRPGALVIVRIANAYYLAVHEQATKPTTVVVFSGPYLGEPDAHRALREHAAIDDLTKSAMAIKTERDKYRVALELIAAHEGKTLLNLGLGADGNRAYQLGANAAFNQAAGFAIAALSAGERTP